MALTIIKNPVPNTPGQRVRRKRSRPEWVLQILMLLALLAIWEVVVRLKHVSPLILPAPSAIAGTFVRMIGDGTLPKATWNTVQVLLESMVLGVAISLLLAAMGIFSSLGGLLLRTLTSVMNPLPGIALLPLVIIWLGFGRISIIVTVLNTIVWVITLNLYAGFQATPQTVRRVARSLELSKVRMLKDVYLPAALPHAMTGLRMAWAYGWRTIIAVELVLGTSSGQAGLGSVIYNARYNFQTKELFSALVVIVILGFVVEQLIRIAERRTAVRWGLLDPV